MQAKCFIVVFGMMCVTIRLNQPVPKFTIRNGRKQYRCSPFAKFLLPFVKKANSYSLSALTVLVGAVFKVVIITNLEQKQKSA